MKKLTDFPDAHLRIFERPALPAPQELQSAYLIGICGTGMGSLAGLLQQSGVSVTGSDAAAYPPMSDALAAMGIVVHEGFRPQQVSADADLVVVGNACSPTHVEATQAREMHLPQASLPEAISEYFIRDRKSIVVAGTHGKTTTTSMLIHVLRSAGFDPGYLVGGVMNNDSDSYSNGTGSRFVIEGDEYDSSYFDKRPKFLHYRPQSAIVTSVEFDHADIYESWDDYVDAFQTFVRLLPESGLLVLNADDQRCLDLAQFSNSRICTYGLTSQNEDLTARNVVSRDGHQSFELISNRVALGRVGVSLSGKHNLLNALAVCAIALDEGLSIEDIDLGLRSFPGIQRRQQIRGTASNVIVVDDFAHHPTAVRATLQATRERWPDKRLIAVFEPRSNSSRRKVFEEGYAGAFNEADAVFLSTPPFRHNDRHEDFLDIDRLIHRIGSLSKVAVAKEGADALMGPLLNHITDGDVVLVMSNGGFGGIHDKILAELKVRETR